MSWEWRVCCVCRTTAHNTHGNGTFIMDLCISLYLAEAVSFFCVRTTEDNDD
jgi:hypothetical protein